MQHLSDNITIIVPKTVSDEQLIEKLTEFLETADLSNTTNSIVRRKLENDFGIDLSDKKAFIREQVAVFLQNQFQEDNHYSYDDDNNNEVMNYARVGQSRGRYQWLNDEGKKRACAVNKVCSVSSQLQKLVGVPELTMTEVMKQVWSYIRERNLQEPKNRKIIKCDELLRSLFGVDSINMFLMNKALSKHLYRLDSENGNFVKERPKKKQKKRDREGGL